jgi:hypothetical protein
MSIQQLFQHVYQGLRAHSFWQGLGNPQTPDRGRITDPRCILAEVGQTQQQLANHSGTHFIWQTFVF